jgi:hypothetical protein
VSLNFDGLFHGVGVAFVVALLGTPFAWRWLRGLSHTRRVLAASLCCLGATALLALPIGWLNGRAGETSLFAAMAAAFMQACLLPFLLFLPRKA